MGVLRANNAQEGSQMRVHLQNLWSSFEISKKKTEILEGQSARWLAASGVVQPEGERSLIHIQEYIQELEKGHTQTAQEKILPRWEGDMNLPHQLFLLRQDVNQLIVQHQQIVTFLGGNFTKVVQESLLQTLGDLQNRLTESECTVALLKQERKGP